MSGEFDEPSQEELDWVKTQFPRLTAAGGKFTSARLIFLRRRLQRRLRSTEDGEADVYGKLILKALYRATRPMTRAEAAAAAVACIDVEGVEGRIPDIRSYFERPGAPRGDSKSLLRRGLVRVAERRRDVKYELTYEGKAEASQID